MELARLQRAMQARVLRGDSAIDAAVAGGARIPVDVRLGIYGHAFEARLAEALAQNYPALRALQGAPAFAALTRAYAQALPPRHFSIRQFGSSLADFIDRRHAGARGRGLADLARFEWSLTQAFDAADAVPVTKAVIEQVPAVQWPDLRFRLAPSVQRLVLATNAVAWWRSATGDGRRPSRWRATRPVEWLIWRADAGPRFRSLAADEARALRLASAGWPFAELCAALLDFHDASAAPVRAVVLLQTWLRDGLIVGVEALPRRMDIRGPRH